MQAVAFPLMKIIMYFWTKYIPCHRTQLQSFSDGLGRISGCHVCFTCVTRRYTKVVHMCSPFHIRVARDCSVGLVIVSQLQVVFKNIGPDNRLQWLKLQTLLTGLVLYVFTNTKCSPYQTLIIFISYTKGGIGSFQHKFRRTKLLEQPHYLNVFERYFSKNGSLYQVRKIPLLITFM
jgi:hypothetical protein